MQQFLEGSETELNKRSLLEIWGSFQSINPNEGIPQTAVSQDDDPEKSNSST